MGNGSEEGIEERGGERRGGRNETNEQRQNADNNDTATRQANKFTHRKTPKYQVKSNIDAKRAERRV